MLASVDSFVLRGIDADRCEIETDLSTNGLPGVTIVGLPDAAVRESVERVRTAIENSGYRWPTRRITINLAPAHLRKEGPVYDLPIAVAILLADGGMLSPEDPVAVSHGCDPLDLDDFLVAGELALDGRVRPIRGAISLALLARDLGKTGVIVPKANAAEAAVVQEVFALGVAELGDVVRLVHGERVIEPHPIVNVESLIAENPVAVDFAQVRGQEAAKRAMTVAGAGGHNVLMLGPAGTGKTMMAKALPGVLPPLTPDEALEVTRIYSSVGLLEPGSPLIRSRPVRAPHHTASAPAIVGGGSVPRPGDVTLAHRGILFLDEMPEFSRAVLETLRQPLEDGQVTIARAHGSLQLPARFMLVAALNPTAQGDLTDSAASYRAMEKYLEKLSGPLIDRIDIHVEVPAVPFEALTAPKRGTDSTTIRARVAAARGRQAERQGKVLNAELSGPELDEHAALDAIAQSVLGQAMTELDLSARAYDKIRRVARTIADIDERDEVAPEHIAEAVQYRVLDRLMRQVNG